MLFWLVRADGRGLWAGWFRTSASHARDSAHFVHAGGRSLFWKCTGAEAFGRYPFEHLVPSCGHALAVLGERPAALAN